MDTEEFVHLFQRYLRSQGLHITTARERIAETVFGLLGHFGAADLWAKLREDGSEFAPATVYRTLDLLVDAGLVRRLHFEDHARYEVSLGQPRHEHLICRHCGRVVEFSDRILEERLFGVVEAHQFLHHDHQLMLWGLCPACQSGSDDGPAEAAS